MVEVLGGEAGMHLAVTLPDGSPRSGNCRAGRPPEPLAMAALSLLPGRGVASWLHLGFWQYRGRGDSPRRSQAPQPAHFEISGSAGGAASAPC